MEHATKLNEIQSDPIYMDYGFLRTVGDEMGEKRDCAVIAIAVVTGRAYTEIHERLRKLGRRTHCGTSWPTQIQVLKDCGFAVHEITGYYEGASIRSIAPQLPQEGKFLVRTHKHIAAVRDGIIEDWSEQRKLYVQSIYKVTDLDEPYPMPEKRRRSVIVNYEKATKAVWTIADILFEEEDTSDASCLRSRQWWSTFRAKVSAECQANGINKTTAAVQVGKWMTDGGYIFKVMT